MKNKIFVTILSICIIGICIYGAKTKLNYQDEKVYSQAEIVKTEDKENDDDINVNSDENKKTSKNKISKKEAISRGKEVLKNGCKIEINNDYDVEVMLNNYDDKYTWSIKWWNEEKRLGYNIAIDAKTGEIGSIDAGYDISPGDPIYKGSKEELYKIIEPLMKELDININDYYINMDPAYELGRRDFGRTIFTNKNDKDKSFVVAIDPEEKRVMEYYKKDKEVK